MKLAVAGGRKRYEEAMAAIEAYVAQVPDLVEQMASGGAEGADAAARDFASERSILFVEFRADWAKYGREAGPIRNRTMLDTFKPDVLLAIPDPSYSPGTWDCIKAAVERGIVVVIIPGFP